LKRRQELKLGVRSGGEKRQPVLTLDQKEWKRREQYVKTPGDEKYFSPWMCAVQRMLPGVQNGTWSSEMRPWIEAF